MTPHYDPMIAKLVARGPDRSVAIDRLVHHSVIVELHVASYRAEAAKRAKGASTE